jgi:cytochrome P450
MSGEGICPVVPGYNPLDPEQVYDPIPAWEQARHENPVFFSPVLGSYVVTRRDDVLQVLGDPDSFSNKAFFERLYPNPPEVDAVLAEGYETSKLGAVANLDPPLHTRVRRILGAGFTPRRVAPLEDEIRAIVDDAIDTMMLDRSAEFVSEFAYVVPLRLILRLLGLPDSQGEQLHQWSEQKMALQWGELSLEEHLEAARGYVEFQRYVEEVVAERRQNPGDDLISVVLQERDEDGEMLDDTSIIGQVMGLVNAGHGTVTSLLSLGIYRLLTERSQWDLLCADPGLAPAVVEEVLRFDAPVKQLFRKVKKPVTIAGVEIPEGARVAFVMGSANRDEAAFADADTFDILAERGGHLAFSKGIHFCLGASLARLQGRVAFARLAERLPSLRLSGDGDFRLTPNVAQRIVVRLNVEWDG